MSCSQCQGIEIIFDKKNAQKEYKHYLKKGLTGPTKTLLSAIKSHSVPIESLLDIGGGVGAIQVEAANWGVAQITNVDGSQGYLEIAKKLAIDLKIDSKIEYHHGDVTDIGPSLSSADIVTLDKVFCCYDNIEKLVDVSSRLANKMYAVVFPRDTWIAKVMVKFANFTFKLKKNPFRIFIHSTEMIDNQLSKNGWQKSSLQNKLFWQIAVYQKA